MKLKKIILDNIRSYEHQVIDFPEGSVLLSGDIGSGKTSILLGIEFALFGLQPGQRGTSLLRNGKDTGGVTMEFEVDGKTIIIERTLKKGKTVSQDYSSITIDGEKKESSVSELKNKVLDLLCYPKEFSKKQNILYKFTVYTPQEEMKQIILQDPETRVNTLRHIFGIDKYKQILENTSILTSKLREEKRMKEGMIINLEQDKANVISKESELETNHYNLVSIEKELFLKTEERKKIQEEKEEISKKIEEKNKIQQEVEKTQIRIINKNESFSNNLKTIEQIKLQIKEFGDIKISDSKLKELGEEILSKKKEKEKLNEHNLEITSQISSINIKIDENQKLNQQISNLEVCPTCLQGVDAVYRANVLNNLHTDTSRNNSRREELETEKKKIHENLTQINSDIDLKEKQLTDLRILKIKYQGIHEKQARLTEMENSNFLLEKDISILKQQIESLRTSVFELGKFQGIFEKKKEELEEALKQERLADIKVAELKKEIQVFSKQIEELKERIKKAEEVKKQLERIVKVEDWLSKQFSSVISFIEKNVMVKLKAEFSQLFSTWFSMLVSDSFEVRLDDDFTPLIEQQDYELDYAYLSGGERTAIALAYRLSLNQVINSLLSKIKTRDLVILDEPTDGFSAPQLDKMRDVLQELNITQLIIVSHEPKIESFVENIIRFRKENGVSMKES